MRSWGGGGATSLQDPPLPQINDKNTGEAKGVMPPTPVNRRVKKKEGKNKGKRRNGKRERNVSLIQIKKGGGGKKEQE